MRKQLERKIQALMGKQQEITAKAKAEGSRSLSAEEETQFNELQREIDIYNGLLKEDPEQADTPSAYNANTTGSWLQYNP